MLYHSKKGKCLKLPNKSKTRISVTITKPYLDALNRLVADGIYLSKGDIILEALRNHLKHRGIEPFHLELAEKPEEPE